MFQLFHYCILLDFNLKVEVATLKLGSSSTN